MEGGQKISLILENLQQLDSFVVDQNDQIQCTFYANVVGNWGEGDVPKDEHMKHFKICPFVQGVDVGKIPVKPFVLTGGYDICE